MPEAQAHDYFPPSLVTNTPYTTTDAYAVVPGSFVSARGHSRVDMSIENSGANSIDAKLVGRHVDAAGDPGDWKDVDTGTLAAAGVDVLSASSPLLYDEYCLQAKATVPASQGVLEFRGNSRRTF